MIFEPQVIDVTVNVDDGINITIDEGRSVPVTTDVVVIHNDVDYYEGEYVVIPKPHDEVVLPTKDKVLSDDVTIREIPYYEVHNETGETVYIAKEV